MREEELRNCYDIAQLEYALDVYFDRHVQPIVDREYYQLENKKKLDFQKNIHDSSFVMSPSGMTIGSPAVMRSGEWSTKGTEYLTQAVVNKAMSSTAINGDFSVIMEVWRDRVIERIGKENYDRLSARCESKDFAEDYFARRFNDKIMNRLARLGAPKSTLDYVVTKGIKNSFLSNPLKFQSEKDAELQLRIDGLFSANARAAGHAASVVADLPLTGTGVWLAVDGVASAKSFKDEGENILMLENYDREVSELLFGNEKTLFKLRDPKYSGVNKEAPLLAAVNGCMERKMFSPKVNNNSVSKQRDVYLESFNGDCTDVPEHIAEDIKNLGINIRTGGNAPAWMLGKEESELHKTMFFYLALAKEMREKGVDNKRVGNKIMTIDEIGQRCYDYSLASRKLQQEREARERAVDLAQQLEHEQQQSSDLMQTAVDSWNPLMKTLGLDGVGDVGRNLGYTLAMLPDMLIGMFTGKSPSLKLENNILPILSIFGGFFVKNPILKMLLMGLGGMNLVNKGVHEKMNAQLESEGRGPIGYMTYSDEVLDRRISNAVVNGNHLALIIDGEAYNAEIGDDTLSAYETGALPLNTLCNAVLRQFDDQKAAMEQEYSARMNEGMENDRNVAIR